MEKIIISRQKFPGAICNGFALIPAILITSLLLAIGLFFLSSVISEKRISESYSISQQAYYLAESGIEYAIWKLKNDSVWQTNFETDPNWTQTYTGGSALFPNGSYDLLIENYDLAKADVTATSTISIGGRQSQRVIKTKIFKALGGSAIDNNAVLADQDINTLGSIINVNNGGIFANRDIIVNLVSTMNVQDKAQAVGDIDVLWWSTLNAAEKHATNLNPPAPAPIEMPAVDFDSQDQNSFKSLAQAQNQLYSKNEFDDLLDDHNPLTLNGVVFVTGHIEIKEGHNLILNGVLTGTGQITIGNWKIFCPANSASLTINHAEGQPSGLFSKSKITINKCIKPINISGILYVGNEIFFNNLNSGFTINGSLIARTVTPFLLQNGVNLNYDNSVVIDTLGATEFSPVITVEYWEEEY